MQTSSLNKKKNRNETETVIIIEQKIKYNRNGRKYFFDEIIQMKDHVNHYRDT
jgi:archaeosine-15-forming tRNA-guanine transglycosylase